jgi:hypothetical protein
MVCFHVPRLFTASTPFPSVNRVKLDVLPSQKALHFTFQRKKIDEECFRLLSSRFVIFNLPNEAKTVESPFIGSTAPL